MDTKLILVEGIPGSGKTTIAKRLYDHLVANNIKTNLYLEGDIDHPIDLGWYAYFCKHDYENFISDYSEYDSKLKQKSIFEDDYVLVQYKDVKSQYFEGELYERLKSREVCLGSTSIVTVDEFTRIFCNRWSRFIYNSDTQDGVMVFESVFFQHQIHDLLRNYSLNNAEIVEHLQMLLYQFSKLNPVLFYISQFNVSDNLKKISVQRNNPKFGTDEAIEYWQNRKTIEYEAMSKLRLKSYVIDNSEYNWDKVFGTIINILQAE